MLSVKESAALLNVTPSRVRALIASNALPAQKVGREWVIREEDVIDRLSKRPNAGRPRQCPQPPEDIIASSQSRREDREHLHKLFLACKESLTCCPNIDIIASTNDPEEVDFYIAVSDFFLQQRQRELVKQGVF